LSFLVTSKCTTLLWS